MSWPSLSTVLIIKPNFLYMDYRPYIIWFLLTSKLHLSPLSSHYSPDTMAFLLFLKHIKLVPSLQNFAPGILRILFLQLCEWSSSTLSFWYLLKCHHSMRPSLATESNVATPHYFPIPHLLIQSQNKSPYELFFMLCHSTKAPRGQGPISILSIRVPRMEEKLNK